MSELRTVHILIEGRVQGVGFRAWCVREALHRGLAGWVRNRKSGAVEAVFSGAPAFVADMLDVVRQGPRFSRVNAVTDLEPVEAPGGRFEIRETA